MLFEYVNKNISNGGVIIMEDIDAMSHVVHRRDRDNSVPLPTAELLDHSESPLTLEYLLNLLQGTLTMDGSTFVATTNHLEVIDPAFYRDGRFDLVVELKACDIYQYQMIYKKILGRSIPPALLAKLAVDKHTPAKFIFHVIKYIMNKHTTDQEILGPFMNEKVDE